MKVDYFSIHFKTSIIPSRTKHESFDSFGSHAQLLKREILIRFFVFFMNIMSLSSLLCSYSKKIWKLMQAEKNSEDSSDKIKKKYVIVSKVVSFFFQKVF